MIHAIVCWIFLEQVQLPLEHQIQVPVRLQTQSAALHRFSILKADCAKRLTRKFLADYCNLPTSIDTLCPAIHVGHFVLGFKLPHKPLLLATGVSWKIIHSTEAHGKRKSGQLAEDVSNCVACARCRICPGDVANNHICGTSLRELEGVSSQQVSDLDHIESDNCNISPRKPENAVLASNNGFNDRESYATRAGTPPTADNIALFVAYQGLRRVEKRRDKRIVLLTPGPTALPLSSTISTRASSLLM